MYGVFYALKIIGMLRVSLSEEVEGLDITEHGAINYPEFAPSIVNTKTANTPALPS